MLKQAYVHGSSITPLIGETIGNNFDASVRWGRVVRWSR